MAEKPWPLDIDLQTLGINLTREQYRQVCILSCFRSQKTIRQAYDELKKQFPEITLEEVKLWFTRLKTNNIDATVGNDERNLRQTSRTLGGLIANLDLDYKFIRVRLDLNEIFLTFAQKGIATEYNISETPDGGCSIIKNAENTTTTIPSEKTFMEEAMNKFKENVERKDVKIEKLRIEYSRVRGNQIAARRTEFFQRLSSVLEGLDTHLACDQLAINVCSPAELKCIVENLNNQQLTRLEVRTEIRDPFDMAEIVPLPQWSNLNNVHWNGSNMIVPLHGFVHIPMTFVNIEQAVSPQEVFEYVMSFLTFPDHLCQLIQVEFDAAAAMMLLAPYGTQTTFNEKTTGRIPLEIGGHLEYTYASQLLTVRKDKSCPD